MTLSSKPPSSSDGRAGARRRGFDVAFAALAFCLSACTSSYQSLQTEHPSAATVRGEASQRVTVWSHFFLYGFIQGVQSDVRDHCASGVARSVELDATLLTTAAAILSLGLYTPIEQIFSCVPEERP